MRRVKLVYDDGQLATPVIIADRVDQVDGSLTKGKTINGFQTPAHAHTSTRDLHDGYPLPLVPLLPNIENGDLSALRRAVTELRGAVSDGQNLVVGFGSDLAPKLFLYFLALTKDLDRIDRMLANMFGASPDGIHDRLVDFTTPVSGAYYYAPPVEALDALA